MNVPATSDALLPAPSATPAEPTRPRLGTSAWVAIVAVAAYWIAVVFIHNTEMAMLPRFISRCVAWLLLVLVFLGSWLLNRHVNWRDRFAAVGWLLVMLVVSGVLAHPTMVPVIVLQGVPTVMAAWSIWYVISRPWRGSTQCWSFALMVPLVLCAFQGLRFEGIDGAQRDVLKWRWTPSAEEQFLAEQTTVAPASVAAARVWELGNDDWTGFRGARRDGVVHGSSIQGTWDTMPPRLVWSQRVGPGWSSVTVVDDVLFTQEQRGASEAVVCYEAETGKEVWSHLTSGRFDEAVSGLGPRATPTFSQGRVYAQSATGILTCIAADTGKQVWTRDLKLEGGSRVPQWGYSPSPLAIDDKIVAYAGGDKGRSLIACDALTGTVIWATGRGQLSYSSPQLVTWQGEQLILMHDNIAMAAFHVEDGTVAWERATGNPREEPMIQPHLLGDKSLLISAGSGLARVEIQCADRACVSKDLWTSNSIKPDFSDVTVHDGFIYGLDDGILCCVDLETGRRRWKRGRYGHGQLLLLADQARLLIACETGEVVLVAASPDRLEEIGRFPSIDGKLWNLPVLVGKRLFIRNSEQMACYEL